MESFLTKYPRGARRRMRNSIVRIGNTIVLDEKAFRVAAHCERLRLYRSESILSLLIIERVKAPQSGDQLEKLESQQAESIKRILEDHLAPIDKAGMLYDGSIAVLLPNLCFDEAYELAGEIEKDCSELHCEVEIRISTFPEDDFSDELGWDEVPSDVMESRQVPVSPENAWAVFAVPMPTWKRVLDLFVASIVLMLVSPLLILCMLLIRLNSPGHPIFAQKRTGHGGKAFMIYKLRTMRLDAEKQVDELRKMSEQDGPAFKLRDDPRITFVGRFLRKLSIDELPQLWNVIRGDMSLVGPRPLPTKESAKLAFWQRERLDVTPGITGLWQVSGRNKIKFDDWMRFDIEYARELSFKSDVKILMQTIPAVVFCRGAS